MSSPTTDIAADDSAVAETPVEKAPRRFPPPCWTQEETLALIEAYRERWYSLRRGYLRTPDWDAVAAAVADRCPGASPAKTSAQCRHKMEKLRQRYRAEKQRALSFPYPAGRYFSSWFFFENMEAMENGTAPPLANLRSGDDSADGSRLQSFIDQNILKLKLKAGNNKNVDSIPDSGFDHNFPKPKRSNFPGDYSSYLNEEVIAKDEPPILAKPKPKKSGKIFHEIHQAEMLPPRLMATMKNFDNPYFAKFPNTNNYSTAPKSRSNFGANMNPNLEPGSKRGRNGVEEIVASIKMLGEGFMKMEKAKMEMAREMEAMRMEMEMKRNQMVLESQKQIVDAFLKGLCELKKSKKPKTGDSSGQVLEVKKDFPFIK